MTGKQIHEDSDTKPTFLGPDMGGVGQSPGVRHNGLKLVDLNDSLPHSAGHHGQIRYDAGTADVKQY